MFLFKYIYNVIVYVANMYLTNSSVASRLLCLPWVTVVPGTTFILLHQGQFNWIAAV